MGGGVGGGQGLSQGILAPLQLRGIVHPRIVGAVVIGGEEQQIGLAGFHRQIAPLGPQGVVCGVALLGDHQLRRGLALQHLGHLAGGFGIAGGDVAGAVAGEDVFLSLRGKHHDQVADLLQLGHRCRLGHPIRGQPVDGLLSGAAGGQHHQGQRQQTGKQSFCASHGKASFI